MSPSGTTLPFRPNRANDRSGSRAPIRFLKQRPFDQLFCAWGHQSLSAHFVDFFTAVATMSNVCSALTPVIPDVSFFGQEWPELADSVSSRRNP